MAQEIQPVEVQTTKGEVRKASKREGGADTPLTVVDLFAARGGLSEGFRQAGFAIAAGSDGSRRHGDLRQLPWRERHHRRHPLPSHQGAHSRMRAERQCADRRSPMSGLLASPQPHPLSKNPRNALYREFLDVLRRTLPPAFVVENVTGMDQIGIRREQIASDLSLDGEYDVLPQVVDAADFGVPQTRKRLLFVGVRRLSGLRPSNSWAPMRPRP